MSQTNKKFCTNCKTTKNSLWRGGPAGPKSLCNACGIKYRKKRTAMLGLNKGLEKEKEIWHSSSSSSSSSSTITTNSVPIAKTCNNAAGDDDMKPCGSIFSGLSETLKFRLFVWAVKFCCKDHHHHHERQLFHHHHYYLGW